jgi:hypothetical protein
MAQALMRNREASGNKRYIKGTGGVKRKTISFYFDALYRDRKIAI